MILLLIPLLLILFTPLQQENHSVNEPANVEKIIAVIISLLSFFQFP